MGLHQNNKLSTLSAIQHSHFADGLVAASHVQVILILCFGSISFKMRVLPIIQETHYVEKTRTRQHYRFGFGRLRR